MEYCSITDGWQVAGYFDSAIYGIFGWYGNGLTYGFFFCALGMWIAYKRTLGGQKNDSRDFALPSLISFLLLIIESYVIRDKGLGQCFGAMFFLIQLLISSCSGFCLWTSLKKWESRAGNGWIAPVRICAGLVF